MSGAYTNLDELIQLANPAQRVPRYRFGPSRALRVGNHRSQMRGRGMDFQEFRGYQPGDDIRTIDWRASARTNRTQTRIYQEERERPVLLVLDQNPSLFFGSQLNFKSVTGAEALALFGWITLHHGDRVGALLSGPHGSAGADERRHLELRPRRSRQHLLRILQHTAAINQSLKAGLPLDPKGLENMLTSANQLTHPGTQVVVISDFHGISRASLKNLAMIARHSEVIAIQVVDPLDFRLPPPGHYPVSDGQHRSLLDSHCQQRRQSYHQQAKQRQKALAEQLLSHRIPLLQLDSSQPTGEQLIAIHQGGIR